MDKEKVLEFARKVMDFNEKHVSPTAYFEISRTYCSLSLCNGTTHVFFLYDVVYGWHRAGELSDKLTLDEILGNEGVEKC